MPLSDDASLFIPYTVKLLPNPGGEEQYCAVQVKGVDIIYASPIFWPTQAEAERHAHDLNYLREESVKRLPATTLWIAVDVAAEGPDAMVVLEKNVTGEGVVGWRLLNPAADDDNAAWESARKEVLNALETLWQDELPEDSESLFEHLKTRHDFDFDGVPEQPEAWYVKYHREVHDKGFDNDSHTHEWNDEEVDADDSSNDDSDSEAAPEGAHEDADRG